MVTMLAASLPAAHAHAEARLRVENHFDGEAEVLVDGRFAALVGGDASVELTARPGRHELTVRRPGTGYTLAATRVQLVPDALVVVPVDAPAGTLRFDHQGEVPLRVSVDGQDVWIAPGTLVELRVTAGSVGYTAAIREPRGEFFALSRTVWVEPGQVAATTLRPDPSVVVVDNHDLVGVRVLVDGRDAGLLAPGAERRVWVRPGPTVVTLIDLSGRVRTETRLVVERGHDAHVVLAGPLPPPGRPASGPMHVAHGGHPPFVVTAR